MVATISNRLVALYKKRDEVMDSDCRAMVLVKTDGLKDYIKNQFPSLSTIKSKPLRGSSESYSRGRMDGEKVGLNRPIQGGNEPKPRLTRGH
jgi:hypothetical protein